MPEVRSRKRYLPGTFAVGWLVCLFVGGSMPPRGVVAALLTMDQLLHFVGFGVLAALWSLALAAFGHSRRRAVTGGVGVSVVAGALLEVWQYFLAYRSFDLMDWAADSAGAVVAAVVLHVVWAPSAPAPEASP